MLGTLDINEVWNLHVVNIATDQRPRWVIDFLELVNEAKLMAHFKDGMLCLTYDVRKYDYDWQLLDDLVQPYNGCYSIYNKLVFKKEEDYTFFLLNKERAFAEFFLRHRAK